MKDNLKAFFTEHWKYMAVSAACKLDLFDNLQVSKTANQLASELSLDEEKLLLLLNALHHTGFLSKAKDSFMINSLSVLLTDSNPERLKYACLNWSGEHLTAWQHLDFSVKEGKSSFEEIYGQPFFEYLNEQPKKLDAYHRAMYEYAIDDYQRLPDLIDFGQYSSVMDVGGSYGAILENIQKKYPSVNCILFDLPKVVEQVKNPTIQKLGGSFFAKIPQQTEAIILSRILHDWNEEKALMILENCYGALSKQGTLYLIENCVDKIKVDLSLLSLNMAVMCDSYERTSDTYKGLFEQVGFQYEREDSLNELQHILTFTKQ